MMTDKPIKSISTFFTAAPFYFIEPMGGGKRFVASFQDKAKTKTFLLNFFETANEIYVKIRNYENYEKRVEFVGKVTKQKLRDALEKYETLIFHDGYHDLMIRLPKTEEYVAFDEHGLVYVYTQNDYSGILNDFGLAYKPAEKLIYEFDHWHYGPPNAKENLVQLIKELGLRKERFLFRRKN